MGSLDAGDREAVGQRDEHHKEHMGELKKQDTKIKIVIGITIVTLVISIISLFA